MTVTGINADWDDIDQTGWTEDERIAYAMARIVPPDPPREVKIHIAGDSYVVTIYRAIVGGYIVRPGQRPVKRDTGE